jgi:uncharacterized FAD-dependent dehydrogenase
MNKSFFDIGIIGSGVAGTFATYKIVHNYKGLKTLVIETGRTARKRRTQMQAFLGLLPSSNGQLFLNDLQKVAEITSKKKTQAAFQWHKLHTQKILNFDLIKDRPLSNSLDRKIKKAGFQVKLNNHIQLVPQEIHNLSKFISDQINDNDKITSIFDTEVVKIIKEKDHFTIITENSEYKCKRILLSVGRSGWRWATALYQELGIVENNDYADFGVRVEMAAAALKDFNHSNCSLLREDLEIGPLSWHGTIIPEDHFDMAISSFRSNESRWETDKVSFNLFGHRYFPNNAAEQINRIGQLTFILTNDRISREKISTLLTKRSKISIMPEYDWLKEVILELNQFMPEIINKGYFHIPTIFPMVPKINIGTNLATEIDGMFVAGESAGIHGILAAITSGIIAGDSLCK